MARVYRMSEESRQRRAARMKALNADPEFNPLAGLTDHQRRIYAKLRRCGVDKAEALAEARKESE